MSVPYLRRLNIVHSKMHVVGRTLWHNNLSYHLGSHTRVPSPSPSYDTLLLRIQLPADVSREAVDDGSSIWVPATHMGEGWFSRLWHSCDYCGHLMSEPADRNSLHPLSNKYIFKNIYIYSEFKGKH